MYQVSELHSANSLIGMSLVQSVAYPLRSFFMSDAPDEVWKPVLGYSPIYEVSNYGNIMSNWLGKKKLMRQRIDKTGRKTIKLYKDGFQKDVFVHRIVGAAFLEDFDHNKVINHIDGNPLNNNLSNLECVTTRENICHGGTGNANHPYRGAQKHKCGRWQASAYIDGANVYIGMFSTGEEANAAYVAALKERGIDNKYAEIRK